jgi:hypothetical protein
MKPAAAVIVLALGLISATAVMASFIGLLIATTPPPAPPHTTRLTLHVPAGCEPPPSAGHTLTLHVRLDAQGNPTTTCTTRLTPRATP